MHRVKAWKTKIRNFDCLIAIDQNVLRFQIPMDHMMWMEKIKAHDNLETKMSFEQTYRKRFMNSL